ncbi:unnamed protein product [Protopolystoma xenopodis]|uniref:Uncharacterized protein n=1 Tax=Protopolystoma xenopodis TaxID=117903 RepID=A0A448XJC0_9PLAT|nr:unnamed protein product [Protopolystoma xenopodis]
MAPGCEFLDSQLDLEKQERQTLMNENIKITEEAHNMTADLRRELNNLQSEFTALQARCSDALVVESNAKSEIESHRRLAHEAREKYERELAMHANDVEVTKFLFSISERQLRYCKVFEIYSPYFV